jgi:hypothetical protein
MPDPFSIVTAAYETVKKLYEVVEKTKDADAKGLIADLRIQLADIKSEVADLRDQLDTAKRKLAERESVEYDSEAGLYWPNGRRRDGDPYCRHCFEKDGLLCHAHYYAGRSGYWSCKTCNHRYNDPRNLGQSSAASFHPIE